MAKNDLVKDSQIQVRISSDEKEQARKVFKHYGLSVSAAVNLFIHRTVEENQLPFNFGPPEKKEQMRKA